MRYAGLWRRFFAFVVDLLVFLAVGVMLEKLSNGNIVFSKGIIDDGTYRITATWEAYVFHWLYFSLMESSPLQATLGKFVLGMGVTDEEGERISFLRATGRYLAKIPSFFILGIGFLMAIFTSRNQALHDLMAKTLIIQRHAVSNMPYPPENHAFKQEEQPKIGPIRIVKEMFISIGYISSYVGAITVFWIIYFSPRIYISHEVTAEALKANRLANEKFDCVNARMACKNFSAEYMDRITKGKQKESDTKNIEYCTRLKKFCHIDQL